MERNETGAAPWSRPVRAEATHLLDQARRLRAGAMTVSLPDPEGAALRKRILGHAERAEAAARSLERAADALADHERVLSALERRRRENGGATQIE
ncbi:hypothetical protein [Streptomyces sp. NPDC051162]|uniref:hypothetical protein n=1 Tax=unclassified Streptomyces TaxID=2593676 RepID=UPI0034403A1B